MRMKPADGAVDVLIFSCFDRSVDRVVGPKLSDKS